MTLKLDVPSWFKATPLFSELVDKQRKQAEAERVVLARERATILAAELKDAPERQKALDAADSKLRAAEAAVVAAREEYANTTAAIRTAAIGPNARLDRITGDLRRLADPIIATTLTDLDDRIDGLRRSDSLHATSQIVALRRARVEISALYELAGVDADAEVARVLRDLDAPPLAAA